MVWNATPTGLWEGEWDGGGFAGISKREVWGAWDELAVVDMVSVVVVSGGRWGTVWCGCLVLSLG